MDSWRIFVVLLSFVARVCFAAPPESLRFTQVLFRHGDRTPSEDFPNNPYGPDDWPNGFGQLTQRGMRQARDLGRFFRARYDGFLNSTYVADEVYVRSSDKDRTLMSAEGVLAGLYPPRGFQVWDPEIAWQPIPVHTQPLDNDIEMTVDVPCKKYNGYYAEALLSEDAFKLYEDNKEMMDYIAEKAGWEAPLLPNIFDTYDPLFCMTQLNMTLPDWVTPDVYSFLAVYYPYQYVFWFYSPQQLYLKTGPFIRLMTDRLQEWARGEMDPLRKIVLYSSHDTMQVSFLMAVDLWNGLKPPYASAIFFELHEPAPDSFTVQIWYKNDTVENPVGEPMLLTVPGCDANCPLEKFVELMKPHMYRGSVDDWRQECDMVESINGTLIAVCILAMGCVVATFITVMLMVKSRSSRTKYDAV